jgi:SAM-dependent methyltransferase
VTLASSVSNPAAEARSADAGINHRISPPLELGLPYWFHLFFPDRALTTNLRILVVGCEDDLAMQLARANPHARVLALEQRPGAPAARGRNAEKAPKKDAGKPTPNDTEKATEPQGLANLELISSWPDEPSAGGGFDLIYYNQSSWPGESPQAALSTAARLLKLEGSLHLTLRANYAWSGVRIVRELFDKLAIQPDAEGYTQAREIVAGLGPQHPWNLLGPDPQMRSDDLLSDWLHVDDPSFSVPAIYDLLAASGLALQRFTHQPYYLPQCSPLARTPLLAQIRRLPIEQQHAFMELYWPGIRHHLVVACRADRPAETFQIDFGGGDWLLYAPLLPANLPVEEDTAPLGAKAHLSWRAQGMPEMAVSLGGFQHRLLRALDRAEELGEVVGLAGLSGDPQLRDEWARDFFQMMSDYDFLHFRICHSPRPPSDEAQIVPPDSHETEQVWADLSELSEMQREAEPPHDSPAASEEFNTTELAGTPPAAELEACLPDLPPLDAEPTPPEQEVTASAAALTAFEAELAEFQEELTAPESAASESAPEPSSEALATPAGPTPPAAQDEAIASTTAVSETAENDPGPKRVPYEGCPLCGEPEQSPLRQVEADLFSQDEAVRILVPWVRCGRCSHVFTSGYFAGETWTRFLTHTLRWRRSLRRAIAARPQASRIVSCITVLRESASGRWLDVGCSDSGLVAVAAEFGYDASGVDCCREAVGRLSALGYAVESGSVFDCKGEPFDVVSLSGVVDRIPYPAQTLTHIQKLLAPRGLLYVSARTSDSLLWRKLDAEDANPYWGRPERYHIFRRESLFRLLRGTGFEPCSYGASGVDGVSMEVIACKR